jgi:O-antigen/teichoic acid export membrane protein
MSLKRNVFASYLSQGYVTLIGIIMVPMYFKYMGPEAYGLVGFFAVLQSVFQMLDMGLTPTMSRETARYLGGAITGEHLCRLMRALEGIFLCVALVGCGLIAAGSELIATRWLNVSHLPMSEVHNAVILMGVIVGLRWMGGLYRGTINGFEHLLWLSSFNALAATARFVLVIPYFFVVGTSPSEFFSYQLIVAVLELFTLVTLTYKLLPASRAKISDGWNWKPISKILSFSLSVAFTSSAWILVTQSDKILLSKILPLSDYAYFTLAVLMASGVFVISAPISAVLLPRLTRLNAEGNEEDFIRIYRQATQIITLLALSVALVLAVFSEHVLWAWTGDLKAARTAAPVLGFYAMGNGLLALSAFPYYLQFAKGSMRLHVQGNIVFVAMLIPSLIWAASKYGAVGAGYAWFGANLAYFLMWVPRVHRRFIKGLHIRWLFNDVCLIFFIALITVIIARAAIVWPTTRLLTWFELGLLGGAILFIAAFGVEPIRQRYFAILIRQTVSRG